MKTIGIKGMSCGHCVAAVTEALEGIEGISHVSVSLEDGTASFIEGKSVSLDAIRKAVKDAGYEAE